MHRRRSSMVCLGITALIAATLTGCSESGDEGSGDPEYAGICVDKSTGVRLDDSVCADDPLPEEADFTAEPAVAGATSSESSSVGTTPTTAPGGAASTTSPVPTTSSTVLLGSPTTTCVPSTLAPGSPTSATSGDATTGQPCPPGQTPTSASSLGGGGGSTTTIYRGSGVHGWYFFPYGVYSPPIGSRVSGGGSYRPPTGTSYSRGGMSKSGGSVSSSSVKGGKVTTSRGGFGGSGGKAGS